MITKSPVSENVESKPKQPQVQPKTVTFTRSETNWEVALFAPPGEFFSDIDFNQITRLLQHNRVLMRRQAALAYLESQAKKPGKTIS